ncbi:MAG: adenylate/guanylate cyclase domain-containing protein [Candidatus Sumerlaeia bacterium]|nr:adenylate/guanylate cyclase domain-containing protein [Candidatus Sumerlaeia bacterium]
MNSSRRIRRLDAPRATQRAGADARPRPAVLLAVAAAFALLAAALPWRPSTGPEAESYDLRLRLRHRFFPQPISPEVLVIGVSQRDSEVFGADLASRQAFQDLLLRSAEWGVSSVAFDYFFEEERALDGFFALAVEGAPTVLGYKFQSGSGFLRPEGDPPEDFAPFLDRIADESDPDALRELRRATLEPYRESLDALLRSRRAADGRALSPEELRETALRALWTDTARRMTLARWFELTQGRPAPAGATPYEARSLTLLSPAPMGAARALGFANIEKGRERIVRRAPLVYALDGRLYPSLALAAVLEHHGVRFADVGIEWGRALRYRPARNGSGEVRIPMDARGDYLVNFRAGEEFLASQPTLELVAHPLRDADRAAARVPERFRGAVVLVGEVITGGTATDTQPIPLQAKYPMVGLHANIVDNILRGDFLREAPRWASPLASLALLLASAWLMLRLPTRRAAVAAAGLLAAYQLAALGLFFSSNMVLPMVVPGVLGLAGAAAMGLYAIGVTERDRRLVREIFGKTVSPRIGEEILRNYADEGLWGAEREVTVLFVDIRGYTSLSEAVEPEVLLSLLDRFYDVVSEAVFRHDGQVNKFIGDAAMALFGALPDEPPDHAARALRSAAEIQRRMSALAASEEFARLGLRLRTGAGINSGPVTVGIVGRRETRIEYTAIGDNVNVAARLQGLADENEIAAGGDTVEAAGGTRSNLFEELRADVEDAGEIAVKGRRKAVRVHRLRLR